MYSNTDGMLDKLLKILLSAKIIKYNDIMYISTYMYMIYVIS